MTDTEPGEGARQIQSLGSRRRRVPLTQTIARRVHAKLSTRLRIDETEHADAGQLFLSRIADLDGDHVVPSRQLEQ